MSKFIKKQTKKATKAEAQKVLDEYLKNPTEANFKELTKKYTVYTIDLLGCGRSDKPNINYTNYLYVQLLTAFVKEVIKTPTNIVATDISASFVIMTNHMDKEVFKKIVLINPISLKQLEVIPDDLSKFKQVIINTIFALYKLHSFVT